MITVRLSGLDNIPKMLYDDDHEKVGNDLLADLIVASPVDTGDFRFDWQIVFTPVNFKIINNKPYATALWYGHSSQAPNGTFDGIVDRYI